MAQSSISNEQRFKKYGQHCPICGGHAGIKQGRGERCAGYESEDGEYVFCTREDYAGNLEAKENTTPRSFCHKMYGPCNCGKEHNPARATNGYKPHKPKEDDKPRIVAEYAYQDASGRLAYQSLRYEPKNFKQRRPDGKGGWAWNMQDATYVPYRLPDLLRNRTETVYIVEGEKDADNLAHIGLVATTNVGGAGKWRKEYNQYLKGRKVIILPDNDDKGREHADLAARSLKNIAASVKIIELPNLPEKGDVSDWLAAGGTREKLEQIANPPQLTSGVLYSDIVEQEIKWLWEGRIPLRKITMGDGMPDQGKSVVSLDIVARVTRGDAMPDGTPGRKGAAIVVAAEDDACDTIKPRLMAARADVSQVVDLSTVRSYTESGEVEERPFTMPRDLPLLEEEINRRGAVLVVLDPLMAILDSNLKSQNDQDVRQALTPLQRMLERTDCACLIIRHFNKGNSDNAILRGAGSMGIIGAARSGMIFTPDPDDPERHVLATPKHNLVKSVSNLVYRIGSDSFGRPKVEWEGVTSYTSAELLSTSKPSEGRQEILQLLREADGPLGPRDIVEATALKYDQARQLLSRMLKDGAIASPARGLYTLSQVSQVSQVSQSSQSSQLNNNSSSNVDCDVVTDDCDSGKECHNSEDASKASSESNVTNVTLVTGKLQLPPTLPYNNGPKDALEAARYLKRWVNSPVGFGQIIYTNEYRVDIDVMGQVKSLRGAQIPQIEVKEEV